MSQDEFQKARRISRAIQKYLETTGSNGLRSTDLYPYLSRNGFVEKDLNNGLKFRQFLNKLYKEGSLTELIPQCKPQKSFSSEIFMEWYFYRVNENKEPLSQTSQHIKKFSSITSDDEIDIIINKLRLTIENLPKNPSSSFNFNERNIRKLYPRAYEIWSARELEVLKVVWKIFLKVEKVSKLLKRQPSAVEYRLKKMGIIE